MFNALVMGLTACITVRTARELFGNDAWRLRRVGTLFALCGLFVLFSSILIRDCYTTFLNSLVIWGLVRWLNRPSSQTLSFAGILTAFAIAAMYYLRARSIVLFGLFWALAGLCWFIGHRFDRRRCHRARNIRGWRRGGSLWVRRNGVGPNRLIGVHGFPIGRIRLKLPGLRRVRLE
jgi:hypothetical protein